MIFGCSVDSECEDMAGVEEVAYHGTWKVRTWDLRTFLTIKFSLAWLIDILNQIQPEQRHVIVIYRLHNQELTVVKNTKCLGVIIQDNGKFDVHINNTTKMEEISCSALLDVTLGRPDFTHLRNDLLWVHEYV